MPLSRLENFLINTEGNILYVNPNDLDSTDSFDNKGNSLTRPFKTIQRALIESARFAYQSGPNNDRFDKTTILLYPGTHTIDNRPGLAIKSVSSTAKYYSWGNDVTAQTDLELKNSTIFDLNNADNVLYKFNSVDGGVIIPKGTSLVGMDLRKTKIRPLYVPDPTKNTPTSDDYIPRSAIFKVTGGCYFWQFSIFDANQSVYFNKTTQKTNPSLSHHKLTCFEYADGISVNDLTAYTDLQMYYYKLMNAYGQNTGVRNITAFPTATDFEPNTPEFKIVGDLVPNDNSIVSLNATGSFVTVGTLKEHGLTVDDSVRIAGVANTTFYEGSYKVAGVSSEKAFSYYLPSTPIDLSPTPPALARVVIEADNVDGSSPYIFNCSLRSVYGMCGLHADGSKATGFKSMVVAQFTGIGLQKDDNAFILYDSSTGKYNGKDSVNDSKDLPLYINQDAVFKPAYENYHIKASNDAVIQAVSTFAIGFAAQFLSESGGEQSITNSNSNFGSKALLSHGFRRDAFDRDDSGYVTHIIPPKDLQEDTFNVIWRTIDPTLSLGVGTAARHYILDAKDQENPPSNISNGYRIGSKKDDNLYFDGVLGGVAKNYSAPILMQAGVTGTASSTTEGPTSEKRHKVARNSSGSNNILNDVLQLEGPHNFINGESVRVYSDNCNVPDGLENGKIYYVIANNSGALGESKIKLASTFNKANTGDSISIKNQDGGVLSVVSTVTDKSPGEIGHPIQWDSNQNNWYILSSSTNTLWNSGFVGFSTDIAANNSTTYVQRTSEGRDLDSRIYRLRYVIPKEPTETGVIAKKPEKNYTIQESKTVDEKTSITTVNSNRNPRVIAGISSEASTGSLVTVTSELPHKLSVKDRVRIRGAYSTLNIDATADSGFNGYFDVTSVPTTKTFTFTNLKSAGVYLDKLKVNRDLAVAGSASTLSVFERVEYDTTYTIQDVETVQEYEQGAQDGIYHLTCLIGNIRPTVEPFDDLKFKQNVARLYPTVDKDNQNNDPLESVSAAVNNEIGKVDSNDPVNSLSKESTINYLKDNRIGIGLTGAVNSNGSSGVVTAFTDNSHNLSGIVTFTLSAAGSGLVGGISTTLYNVPLLNNSSGYNGDGATGNFVITSGSVTAFDLVDSGSAYSVGDVLKVGSTGNATVTVSKINDAVGKAVQVVGVGVTSNRNDSGYNGLYKVTGISSCKSVTYDAGANPGDYVGISTLPQGMIYAGDEAVPISTIVGTAGTTLAGIVNVTTSKAHGLIAGNKIKIAGVTGVDASNFNTDFVVSEKINLTSFTVKASIGIGTDNASLSGAEVYKYNLGAFGQSQSFELENIAGSYAPLNAGISTTMSDVINVSSPTLSITNYLGFDKGDFLQIDNEIVRVTARSNANSTDLTVIRGILGTRATTHENGSIVRKIKVIPTQTHRYSSIRASGHTFEYVGYGPGNYSTALPAKQVRSLTDEEESLALSREEKGGIVFFSGMNDRGDYFTGDRVTPRENFLGEIGSDATGVFDDLYVRNTLRVGGGPNRNLPSDFRGPVNFGNKITSTAGKAGDPGSGIEAIKLLLKGTATQNPSFLIGDETSPSFVVKEDTQRVGIQTADPEYELDVNGTIRANAYNNFELTDLPTTLEPTFQRNRILMVKTDETGYELIDSHELPAYELRSYGVSNDPTIYVGDGSTNPAEPLTISGISTAKFYKGEKVKVFGATEKSVAEVGGMSDPSLDTDVVVERAGAGGGAPYSNTYYYWVSEYHERNGRIGISSQISPDGNYTGSLSTKRSGVGHTDLESFNSSDFIRLRLRRSSVDHGLLIYRQDYEGTGTASNADIEQARLVAILGEKQLRNETSGITWSDYGVYEKTEWSPKNDKNEYVGSATTDVATEQIHFPVIGTTGAKRGWNLDEIVSIGANSITLADNYYVNSAVAFGSTSVVKVVHDNTYSLRLAIDKTVASGGNYLTLPSGTYLANQIVVPTSFTLKGNGKNTVLKQQYFATDLNDDAQTIEDFDNIANDGAAGDRTAGTYSITATGGTGSGAKFSVVVAENGSATITLTNGGINYTDNDTLTLSRTGTYGGTTADITVKVNGLTTLTYSGNFIGIGITNGKDVTIQELTVDGNNSNNVTFNGESDNYLLYFKGINSALFKDMEIRNSPGGGLTVEDSKRVSVENSTFVDGCVSDVDAFKPIDAQNSETVRVNDNLFENYPGPVDLSVTSIVSTGGNIIRNCGTGIDAYATAKITTSNNIILGPSDEWLPSPDIYDSDWNSVNISITPGNDWVGPRVLYLEENEPKDMSSGKVTITSRIGELVGLYNTLTTPSIGSTIVELSSGTLDDSPDDIDREHGYYSLTLPKGIGTGTTTPGTWMLDNYRTTPLAYEAVATEYRTIPVGYAATVGIATGFWTSDGTTEATVGTACTQYVVQLQTPAHFSGIATGHVCKLTGHAMGPDISSKPMLIAGKNNVNAENKQFVLSFAGDLSYKSFLIPAGSVSVGDNDITVTNHGLATGDELTYIDSSANVIQKSGSDLSINTTHYVIKVNDNKFQLSNTLINANAGSEYDITSAGTGNHRFANITALAASNGGENGYISIRNTFTIFKGRVGVI